MRSSRPYRARENQLVDYYRPRGSDPKWAGVGDGGILLLRLPDRAEPSFVGTTAGPEGVF